MDCIIELGRRSPRKSIRCFSAENNVHGAFVQRIVGDDLHLFPYKSQSQRELTPEQRARSFEFAQWFSGKLETNRHFTEKIHITDECHGHLLELVNK